METNHPQNEANSSGDENAPLQDMELPASEPLPAFRHFPFKNHHLPVFIIALSAIVFYFNSIFNEYALDDGTIIHQNEFVLKGIAGIGDILTHDEYHSFYKRMNANDQLAGGRYKPLPVITYAIEQELIKPYRSGNYYQCYDLNQNGRLDNEPVKYVNRKGGFETAYEYDYATDRDNDGTIEQYECYQCWDIDYNSRNTIEEDLNADGIYNEVDCQVYGAPIRHFNNIWLFALCCVFLYILLSRYLFIHHPDLAFLSAFIYTIHPVNSEVVANVIGRQDIFSVLFISLTLIFMFRFYRQKKTAALVAGGICYLMALLSGDNALLLLLIVPLITWMFTDEKPDTMPLVVSVTVFLLLSITSLTLNSIQDQIVIPLAIPLIVFFIVFLLLTVIIGRKSFFTRNSASYLLVLLCVCMFYAVLRLSSVKITPVREDTEILNNPFLLATDTEAFATKLSALLKYIRLFLFPHPLISDYSYATYSYPAITDFLPILSIIIYVVLIVLAYRLCRKKHIAGFGLAFYLIFIVPASNLFFFTRLLLHEGYLFHAGIGLCITFSWLLLTALDYVQQRSRQLSLALLVLFLLIITPLAMLKTLERNRDWKNDVTLFLKDVKNAPNSVLVLGNAGARWIDLADTREITGVDIPGMENKKFNDYNGTLVITPEEIKKWNCSDMREAALHKGIEYLEHAIELHPRYINGYLNLGLAHYKLNNDEKAMFYWKCAESLYPNSPYLSNYYNVFENKIKNKGINAFNDGDMRKAAVEYRKWTVLRPRDGEAWYNLGGAYFNLGLYQLSYNALLKACSYNPDNESYKELLAKTSGLLNNLE